MKEKISWTNERRTLGDLRPWTRNPREIGKEQANRLADSFISFGQVEAIAIGPANEVYNGHQRIEVLTRKFGMDYEVDVRVASRPLTEKEREKLTIYLHEGATGEWNFDLLNLEFDLDELVDWGFEARKLGFEMEKANDGKDKKERYEKPRKRHVCPDCGYEW